MYDLLKCSHMLLAAVTITGFLVRGYWMMSGSALLSHRTTRIAPHIIDSLFLLTGVALMYSLSLPVLETPWILAKFAGLLFYVVLGTIALRRGPTIQLRIIAFVAAVSAFAYVVGAAVARSSASWLAYLYR